MKDNLQPGIVFAAAQLAHALHAEKIALMANAAPQSLEQASSPAPQSARDKFCDVPGRIKHPRRPFASRWSAAAIFAGLVQPAYRREPAAAFVDEVIDCLTPFS